MNSTKIFFLIFGIISLLISVTFSVYGLKIKGREKKSERGISTWAISIAGVFLALVTVFIPICYNDKSLCGDAAIHPFLVSVYRAIQIFVLGSDFSTVSDTVSELQLGFVGTLYSVYCSCLYVAAPVLTFATVLSLFKSFRAELRYIFCFLRPIYIMSELNERSIAIAKSIREDTSVKNPLIVFADVYETDSEESSELMIEALNLKAVCLKRDVTNLQIIKKRGNVEIFLIGEDESENVSQAVAITEKLESDENMDRKNPKQNVKVFVFAVSDAAAHTVDSIYYPRLLTAASKNNYNEQTFKLRIVNHIRQLAWQSIREMDLIPRQHGSGDKISVVILGAGDQGIEFFKALIWYCQVDGLKLEITLIDQKSLHGGSTKAILKKMCPELIEVPKRDKPGDAVYDIEIYDDIDMNTDSFERSLMENPERRERLKRAKTVIVALGDDNLNIETAVYLRRLYDRVNVINKSALERMRKEECLSDNQMPRQADNPQIYSIVYDKVKAGIVKEDDDSYLLDQAGESYQIHFIGSINHCFSRKNIYDYDLEKSALKFHVGWAEVNLNASTELKDIRTKGIDAIVKEYGYSREEAERLRKMAAEAEHVKFGGYEEASDKEADFRKYEESDYCRMSSLASALHKKMLEQCVYYDDEHLKCEHIKSNSKEPRVFCPCKTCLKRKMTEHARWNAYMRSMGFRFSGQNKSALRADRALLHCNLCSFADLSIADRIKD